MPHSTQRSASAYRSLTRALASGGLLWLAVACSGASEAPFQHAEALDSLGAAALIDGPIAGLSIAVARGGEVVYERGFGVADLTSGSRASASTVYNIASTAKILAAVAVMNLVESGRIDLDDSLGTLLPDVPNRGAVGDMTLRQLLNMTSGLRDYVGADIERLEADPNAPLSSEFVLDFVRTAPLTHEPGTNWIYTNTGFYLAGLIVERVTGRPWGDFIIEDVVRPLGLRETHLCDDVIEGRARGYERVEDRFVPSVLDAERGVRGDAGLCASVRDLARLPEALAHGSVISSAGLNAMTAPTALGRGLAVDYGLGVSSGEIGGHRLWGHLGGSGSIVSTLAHYPDDDVTVAVLVNTRGSSLGALALEGGVAEIVLGLVPSLADMAVDSATGAALQGIYTGDREATRVEMAYDDASMLRVSADGSQLPLLHQGADSFGRADWPFDRFVFQRVNGRAEAYSAYYNGFFDGYYRRVE